MTPEQVNERVERDVRILIGDLHLQLIVLRAQLEQAQGALQAVAQNTAKPNGGVRPEVRT